jgi:hypothetical protein
MPCGRSDSTGWVNARPGIDHCRRPLTDERPVSLQPLSAWVELAEIEFDEVTQQSD